MSDVATKADVNNLRDLVLEISGSLTRQIEEGFSAVTTRFDTQAQRLERHAALLQTGSRWTARMNDWAEKVDASLETKDREIAELRERLGERMKAAAKKKEKKR